MFEKKLQKITKKKIEIVIKKILFVFDINLTAKSIKIT